MSKEITRKKKREYGRTICGNCGFKQEESDDPAVYMNENCTNCGKLLYYMPKDGLISISATARGFLKELG